MMSILPFEEIVLNSRFIYKRYVYLIFEKYQNIKKYLSSRNKSHILPIISSNI